MANVVTTPEEAVQRARVTKYAKRRKPKLKHPPKRAVSGPRPAAFRGSGKRR